MLLPGGAAVCQKHIRLNDLRVEKPVLARGE